MKPLIFLIAVGLVGAFANIDSIATLSIVLVIGYLIYTMGSNKTKSVTSLLTDDTKILIPDSSINNMLTDLGTVSACIASKKDVDISGKALLKSTHKVLTDTSGVIKNL